MSGGSFGQAFFDDQPRNRINIKPADPGAKRSGKITKAAFLYELFGIKKLENPADDIQQVDPFTLVRKKGRLQKLQHAVNVGDISGSDGGQNVFTQFGFIGQS